MKWPMTRIGIFLIALVLVLIVVSGVVLLQAGKKQAGPQTLPTQKVVELSPTSVPSLSQEEAGSVLTQADSDIQDDERETNIDISALDEIDLTQDNQSL